MSAASTGGAPSTLNRLYSPSEIGSRALGLRAEGLPAKNAGVCALCGVAIAVGDFCLPAKYGPGFVDAPTLAARHSPYFCGWCPAMMTVEYLRATKIAAFSLAGALPFSGWADVARVLMEPPEPPFILMRGTKNNQHMIWRTPVSYSRDYYYARVGLMDVSIRRPILAPALAAGRRLEEALMVHREATGQPIYNGPGHVFASLNPDLEGAAEGHAKIRSDVANAPWAASGQSAYDLALLRSLSLGETWALRFIITSQKTETKAA